MAKSNLIIRRKKSTVLVSTQTLQDAIRSANALMETMDVNDPDANKIEGAVQHFSRILKANPQQMKMDGASSIADYMDDAKMPAEARRLKQEVDMIATMTRTKRGPGAPAPGPQEVGYVPDSAVINASAKQADAGAAGFVTDRDEKGEAKAPERLEVPRLAARKKKKEAEDPALDAAAPAPVPEAAAPAPAAAAPAPAAGNGSINPIDYIPTESLIKVIGELPKEEDFAQNKNKQDALVALTEVLKSRPVLPPEQPEAPKAPQQSTAPALANGGAAAAPAPVPVAASSKKAELGDHAMGQGETISNGSGASAQIGQGGTSSASPQISPDAAKPKQPDFGGLNLSSSLEEEKTADDYRVQDYRVSEEGIRPSGALPTMDEQEAGGHHSVSFPEQQEMPAMSASIQAAIKEGKTPPGISEELMHKLKKQYPGEKDKAYATAWKIHNEKESSLKVIAAELEKIAANSNDWFVNGGRPVEVIEDGGRTPEIGEAHSKLEDHTSISRPDTVKPIKLNEQQTLKQAADLSLGSAVKKSEGYGNDLKKMYLEAKSLTNVNDTRAVREAVEMIFRAADAFDEATKALNKQHQQEESEAAAAKVKAENKGKKSSFGGLAVAAGE